MLADAAYTLANYLMGDPADAEDAVVECYRLARRRYGSGVQGDARPWLLAILRTVCDARMARRASRGWIAPDQLGPAGDVRGLIHGLPRLPREALVLRECCGLSYSDIATVVGATPGAVLGRLRQAQTILRAGPAFNPEVASPRSPERDHKNPQRCAGWSGATGVGARAPCRAEPV